MKTKYLLRYLNRSAHFDADLELIDVLAAAVKAKRLQQKGGKIFDFVDAAKHPRLGARQDSDNSRRLAITHLKTTVHAAFIKDLYEDAMHYFRDLLQGAASAGLSPDRLVGEHKVEFTANEILGAGSWEGVIHQVSGSLFRALENLRSTEKLLKAMDAKLGLGVDQKVVAAALPYIELRHLLVHSDGVPDKAFCKRYKGMGAVAGKKIALNYQLVAGAKRAIDALVAEYDARAVAVSVCPKGDLQP